MPGADDEKLKTAGKLVCVLYRKGELKSLRLDYNSSKWYDGFTMSEKLALRPKEKFNVWYKGECIMTSLCAISVKNRVHVVEKEVFDTVAAADHNLSDMSFATLVTF